MQAHTLACMDLNTPANTLGLMRKSQNQREENNGTFGFDPRLLLGFTVGVGGIVLLTGILTEPHPSGQRTDLSPAVSCTELLRAAPAVSQAFA